MFRTVIRNEEMDRKQLKFTKSTFEYLSDEASGSVRSVTRGMLMYEMVMMFSESLSDEIGEKERRVNDRLESLTDSSFRCAADSIKVRNEDGSYPSQTIIDPDDDLTENLINIYLPVSVQQYLEEEWGQRYWAEKVDDLVSDYIDSAYESRYDRYACKEQLCEYIENDEMPDHRVALSIVEGDDSWFDVRRASEILTTDKWYLRSDLDYDDIIQRAEEEFDQSTPFDTKKEVAEKILIRYAQQRDMKMPRKMAVALISDAFDVSESYVENEYLPEIELPDYTDGDEIQTQDRKDYYELCLSAKNNLIEFFEDENEIEKKSKVERMNAPNVCLVEKQDIEELDSLDDEDARNEKIGEILDKGSYSQAFDLNPQNQLHRDLKDELEEELS